MSSVTRRALLEGAVAVLAAAAAGCRPRLTCDDRLGVRAVDVEARLRAGYLSLAPDAASACERCRYWLTQGRRTAPELSGCGECQLLTGPVAPGATCRLFVASG